MLELSYEGWFQVRMATDPDPTDEPRGLTGPTVATPSEPDLDRIVRLQHPVAPRWPGPAVGVRIRTVTIDGVARPDYPLTGGTVDLIDSPQFWQLNYVIVAGLKAPIDPFHVEFASADRSVIIRRRDEWDLTRPGLAVTDVFTDPAVLARRDNTIAIADPQVAEATGIVDYPAYRAERLGALRRRVDELGPDTDAAVDVRQRIIFLERDASQQGQTVAALGFLGMRADYRIDVNGEVTVVSGAGPGGGLGGSVGVSQLWPMRFWLGGYDVDLMVGYMRGTVSIPFVARPGSP